MIIRHILLFKSSSKSCVTDPVWCLEVGILLIAASAVYCHLHLIPLLQYMLLTPKIDVKYWQQQKKYQIKRRINYSLQNPYCTYSIYCCKYFAFYKSSRVQHSGAKPVFLTLFLPPGFKQISKYTLLLILLYFTISFLCQYCWPANMINCIILFLKQQNLVVSF